MGERWCSKIRAAGVLRLIDAGELQALAAGLGPEPLSPDFTFDIFRAAARSSRQPAKLFLMDQRRIAGLGNIYAAEALFRAQVHPLHSMCRLSRARLRRLHAAIVEVLSEAVGGADTTYSKPGTIAEADEFQPAVYGREGEPCRRCQRPIRRIQQGGRSTYFCPRCQPAARRG